MRCSLCVVCCVLFVYLCSLCGVGCVVFVVWCLLCGVRCVLFVVRPWLSSAFGCGWSFGFVVCCRSELSVVRCWLLGVPCFFFVASFRLLILLFVFCRLLLLYWLCVVLRAVFDECCVVVCRFLLFGILGSGL